jgi:hypothetical protein
MKLSGRFNFPSYVIVVNSTFNDNGTPTEGAGVSSDDIAGTFVSCTMNNNTSTTGGGFVARGIGEITLIDVTTNDNAAGGIVVESPKIVNVIDSIACGNDILDMAFGHTAQANTCDSSFPDSINELRVCQCSCQGHSTGRKHVGCQCNFKCRGRSTGRWAICLIERQRKSPSAQTVVTGGNKSARKRASRCLFPWQRCFVAFFDYKDFTSRCILRMFGISHRLWFRCRSLAIR